MGRIGMSEVIFVFLVIILLFGAKKLPEIGRAMGRAIKEFKKAGKEIEEEIKDVRENTTDEQKEY